MFTSNGIISVRNACPKSRYGLGSHTYRSVFKIHIDIENTDNADFVYIFTYFDCWQFLKIVGKYEKIFYLAESIFN